MSDKGYTLQSLAHYFGWGAAMSDRDIWLFVVQRENLLREAQALLETHKSHAATAEEALRERIEMAKILTSPLRLEP